MDTAITDADAAHAAPDFERFATVRPPGLLRFATVLSGDPATAEDVVQEVLIRAAPARPELRPSGVRVGLVAVGEREIGCGWWRRVACQTGQS